MRESRNLPELNRQNQGQLCSLHAASVKLSEESETRAEGGFFPSQVAVAIIDNIICQNNNKMDHVLYSKWDFGGRELN